ncbi:MAG: hypothetical protein ABW199_07785 [Caulobacterales bacterium]
MGKWPRSELESAFDHYQKTVASCRQSGDWRAWSEMFTDDIEFVEHVHGAIKGKKAMFDWISRPSRKKSDLDNWAVAWLVIDEDRGWVIVKWWNRFRDLGDGSIFQFGNITHLVYAGNNQWSYKEDAYSEAVVKEAASAWAARRDELAGKAAN